jgi:hypothetical protein
MNKTSQFVFAAVITAAITGSAHAGTVHGAWEAHAENGVCWAITQATKKDGPSNRGNTTVAVTQRPMERSFDAVSIVSGFSDVTTAKVTATIDGRSFDLLAFGDSAFPKSGKPEQDMIAAMRNGREMRVVWTSPAGRRFEDVFSLQGFTAAYRKSDSDCTARRR